MKILRFIILMLIGTFIIVIITDIIYHRHMMKDYREFRRSIDLINEGEIDSNYQNGNKFVIKKLQNEYLIVKNELEKSGQVHLPSLDSLYDSYVSTLKYTIPSRCGCTFQIQGLEKSHINLKNAIEANNSKNLVPLIDDVIIKLTLLDTCYDECKN